MKTVPQITTFVVSAMLVASALAQNATKPSPKEPRQRVCHTMGNLDRLIHQDPKMTQRMGFIEKQTQSFVEKVRANPAQRSQMVVTIPVVFHVLYNTAAENISEAQILSQLQILNDDFRRLNADQDTVWAQAADTQIEFCLATQDPQGNPTDGILRVSTNVTSFGTNDAMKFTSQGGSDAWPAADYMNFWVCDLGFSLLGYAQFPGGPADTDGIVCNYTATGNIGTAQSPFDLGRTATHEVGHYLNLRHIWGDDGCGASDFVDDTPDSDGPNYGCALGNVACGTEDMVQNYMDYSDDVCMNLFTQGQSDRMNALFAPGGARASLVSSPGCTPATPDFDLDAQAQLVIAPQAVVCAASVTPVIRIRNNGALTLTSLDITYSIDGVVEGSTSWTGSLEYSATAELTLADIAPADGNHSFSFTVSNPNGSADQNTANDTASSEFFMNSTGSGVTITVGGGSWDSEIGWSLELNGTVYASGGAGTTTECIPNGCYIFNMTDSYGDGWNGAIYTISDAMGSVIATGSIDNAQVSVFDGNNINGGDEAYDFVQIGGVSCGFGCTDPAACNYDAAATLDDGSCDFACIGCTDPNACNYDPTATIDDGSCTLPDPVDGCVETCDFPIVISETLSGGEFGSTYSIEANGSLGVLGVELDWTTGTDASYANDLLIAIGLPDGSCVEFGGFSAAVSQGCTDLGGTMIWPADWGSFSQGNSGTYFADVDLTTSNLAGDGIWSFTLANAYTASAGVGYNITLTLNGLCTSSSISVPGCTDPTACNYDDIATSDDGSCLVNDECGVCGGDNSTCGGCTDPSACNYNPESTEDDGTCEFTSCAGCTDEAACNYNAGATTDDGSCEFTSCAGCTEIFACNYDATATIDDGSCILPYDIVYEDLDGDGIGSDVGIADVCDLGPGLSLETGDCDDSNELVYPGAPGTGEGIDNNCDGVIDGDELVLNLCPEDLNQDGQVTVADILQLLADFGCTSNCDADLNEDGATNVNDILQILAAFGSVC